MIGLLRAEILRLTSRRLARVTALIFLGIVLLIQVVAGARSHEPTPLERSVIAEQMQEYERYRAECEAGKAAGSVPADADCGDVGGFISDPRYRADERVGAMATGIAIASAMLAFIVGASYVGAEWATGTMQALLFWEPRRARVVLSKAAALVLVVVAFTAVMQAVGWLTTMAVAGATGTTEGATAGVHMSAFLTMLRGMLVVTSTALLGFAIGGIARITAAALGFALIYFVLLENLLRANRPGWSRYLFTENVGAVMSNGFEAMGYRVSAVRGAITLAVYLALLVGAFYAAFERRDVT